MYPAIVQWKYHWEEFRFADIQKGRHIPRVQQLGSEGWELAAIEVIAITLPIVYVFKRPVLIDAQVSGQEG